VASGNSDPPKGLAVARYGAVDPRAAAARSRAMLTRPLAGDAELEIGTFTEAGALAGAFQRGQEPRRGSGGPRVHVGPGTLRVALLLERPDALVPCDAPRLVNRYVRPLLRALAKSGAVAHYFGRDWLAVAHRPAGAALFAHDAATGRAAFEAFVAVTTPFVAPGDVARGSFLGKAPGTLATLTGRPFDPALQAALADRVVSAYAEAYARTPHPLDAEAVVTGASADDAEADDTAWEATVEEVIGTVGAGKNARGRFEVGGDFLASTGAVRAVAEGAEALAQGSRAPTRADVAQLVQAAFGTHGVALLGVRSLESLADVIARALGIP
jgi:hypothetical protein